MDGSVLVEKSFKILGLSFSSKLDYWFLHASLHVWGGGPRSYLELLHKQKKLICRTAVPSFAASLEPLIHRRNDASLSLFYRNCFSRCSSELAQLVPLSYFLGRSPVYSDRLHDFSITIPRCCKDVYFNSFFPRTTRL